MPTLRVTDFIFKVDGPGNVVTILMSQGIASTSDTFVTKTKNDRVLWR